MACLFSSRRPIVIAATDCTLAHTRCVFEKTCLNIKGYGLSHSHTFVPNTKATGEQSDSAYSKFKVYVLSFTLERAEVSLAAINMNLASPCSIAVCKNDREEFLYFSLNFYGVYINITYSPHIPHEKASATSQILKERCAAATRAYRYGANLAELFSMSSSDMYFHLPPFAFSFFTSLPMNKAKPFLTEH